MDRSLSVVARLVPAVLLAIGLLVMPGQTTSAPVALAADCPSPPITISKVVAGGARCYGGRLLTFRAYVPRVEGVGGT
jgi:hypothetical protein